MAYVTNTEDLFEDEDGETGEDDKDDEAEAAYQRTKAFGDIDRDVIPQFYIHIY